MRSEEARRAPVSLELVEDRPIQSVLAQVQEETGTRVLVHWAALIRDGWTPATRIPWETDGTPLEETLDELTYGMKLILRSIDESTLLITTRLQSDLTLDVEVYPLAPLLKKVRLERIQTLADASLGRRLKPENGMVVRYDPTCQCLVASLPQSLQIRLEKSLQRLAAE